MNLKIQDVFMEKAGCQKWLLTVWVTRIRVRRPGRAKATVPRMQRELWLAKAESYD